MLRRNIFRKVSYAELSEDDMEVVLDVAPIATCSSSSSGSNPEVLEIPPPSALSPAPSSEDLFTAHWPVDALMGLREKYGDPSGYFLVKWKG
jgi:hypothetical protein